MTNEVVDSWVRLFEKNEDAFCLSTENVSWSYSELAALLKVYSCTLNPLKPTAFMLEGDYSLESVAWLITGLAYGWKVVPVVSKNGHVIESRLKISGATHRVSAQTDWTLQKIDFCVSTGRHNENDESGVVLFSSGSTGEPKAMCKKFDLSLTMGDKKIAKPVNIGMLLLFDHIGGLNTLFSGLKKGAHLVAPIERSPRLMAALIEKHSVRVLPCSPTFLNMMYLDGVFEDFQLKSLRLVTYGTERMPEQLLIRLSKLMPRTKFLQTFGTSETGILQTKSLSSSSTFLTIDDPSVEWRIVDEELWLKSKTQISGYMNVDEQAINDGWFKTGDLVEVKDADYFRIIGRKKEVINVGGEKVLPAEIEDFIMADGHVIDCTAFAIENGITGQSVGIKIVPIEGIDKKVLKKHIRKICSEQLESFKVPVKIIFSMDIQHTERFKKEK